MTEHAFQQTMQAHRGHLALIDAELDRLLANAKFIVAELLRLSSERAHPAPEQPQRQADQGVCR